MNRDHVWLTDAQFAKIVPHLPTTTRGKPRVDDRRVISGIIHVLKSGGPLGRRAGGVRAEKDALQPLHPLDDQGRLGSALP